MHPFFPSDVPSPISPIESKRANYLQHEYEVSSNINQRTAASKLRTVNVSIDSYGSCGTIIFTEVLN